VNVKVRYFQASDHQADPRRAECYLGGVADPPGDIEAVVQQRSVRIRPLIYLLPRHDQRVAGGQRGNRKERNHRVVGIDEPAGQFAVDDPRE